MTLVMQIDRDASVILKRRLQKDGVETSKFLYTLPVLVDTKKELI